MTYQGMPARETVGSGRRGLIAGASALAATISLAKPFIGSALAANPVPLGLVIAKSGVWGPQGEAYANGARLAIEQAGAEVLGRPIKLIWYDEPSPQGAQQNLQKLIDEEKAVGVVGGSNSATALAMSAVAARAGVPLVIPGASAKEITGALCNPYTFRVIPTTQVLVQTLKPTLAGLGKRWYFLCASYAWGQDIYNTVAAEGRAMGATEVGNDQVGLGTTDFSAYILKIRQARPDALVLGITGADIVSFLKQFEELGMKDRVPVVCPTVSDLSLWEAGPQAATGTYGMPWCYNDPSNSPEDVAFVAEMRRQHGAPPALSSWLTWTSMKLLLAGLRQAGSTDGPRIVKALETLRTEDGGIPAYFRASDHQLVRRCLAVRVKEVKQNKWDYFEVLRQMPRAAGELEALYGTTTEIGCKMASV